MTDSLLMTGNMLTCSYRVSACLAAIINAI